MANGEFVCVCASCAKIPKFGPHTILADNGAGVRLPPPRPVIKEFHRGNIFFLPPRKYWGNIVPNLQSSDPSPTSSASEPYLHRALRGGEGGEELFKIANAAAKKNRCGVGGLSNGLLSFRLTLKVFSPPGKNLYDLTSSQKLRESFCWLTVLQEKHD